MQNAFHFSKLLFFCFLCFRNRDAGLLWKGHRQSRRRSFVFTIKVISLPLTSSREIWHCFSNSGIRPYCNSDIRLRSPAHHYKIISIRACSGSDLICCVPDSAAFSAFQTASSSAKSRSFSESSLCRVRRRFHWPHHFHSSELAVRSSTEWFSL